MPLQLIANSTLAAERAAVWLTCFGTDFTVTHSRLRGEWTFAADTLVLKECMRVNQRDYVPFRMYARLQP